MLRLKKNIFFVKFFFFYFFISIGATHWILSAMEEKKKSHEINFNPSSLLLLTLRCIFNNKERLEKDKRYENLSYVKLHVDKAGSYLRFLNVERKDLSDFSQLISEKKLSTNNSEAAHDARLLEIYNAKKIPFELKYLPEAMLHYFLTHVNMKQYTQENFIDNKKELQNIDNKSIEEQIVFRSDEAFQAIKSLEIKPLIDNDNINKTIPKRYVDVLLKSVGYLSNLTNLAISDIDIEQLPQAIGELSKLVYLDLSYNKLVIIPNVIGLLSNLRGLFLRHNKIVELPAEIGNCKELTEVWIDGNKLSDLPSNIGNLKFLKILNAGNNNISSIPLTINFLENLNELGLYGNKLITFPSISGCVNLRFFNISNNKVKFFPDYISKLSALTTIYAYTNEIKCVNWKMLPPTLERLDLRENKIETLNYDNKTVKTTISIGKFSPKDHRMLMWGC